MIISGRPENRTAFAVEQHRISQSFRTTLAAFPPTKNTTYLLAKSEDMWQSALTTAGLWGGNVWTFKGPQVPLQIPLANTSDDATATLVELQKPFATAMANGLHRDADLEHILMVALLALFGLAFAVTVHFKRRMNRDLVRQSNRLWPPAVCSRSQPRRSDCLLTLPSVGGSDHLGHSAALKPKTNFVHPKDLRVGPRMSSRATHRSAVSRRRS